MGRDSDMWLEKRHTLLVNSMNNLSNFKFIHHVVSPSTESPIWSGADSTLSLFLNRHGFIPALLCPWGDQRDSPGPRGQVWRPGARVRYISGCRHWLPRWWEIPSTPPSLNQWIPLPTGESTLPLFRPCAPLTLPFPPRERHHLLGGHGSEHHQQGEARPDVEGRCDHQRHRSRGGHHRGLDRRSGAQRSNQNNKIIV